MILDDVDHFFRSDVAGETRFTAGAEADSSIREREKGMVVTDTDILSCLDFRPALANDNHARACRDAVSELHAEIFRF